MYWLVAIICAVAISGSDPCYIQMNSTIARMRGLPVAPTLAKPFRKHTIIDLLTSLARPDN